MALILPSFEATYCRAITVCGKPDLGQDKTLISILPKKPFIISYKAAGHTAYLRLLSICEKATSVHIDCAKKENFPSANIPKPTGTKLGLDRVFKRLDGISIDAGISAIFELPLTELPEGGLIRSSNNVLKSGSLKIRQISAVYKIEGAPISLLSWDLPDNEKDLCIQLVGSTPEKIGDDYLIRSLNWINNIFNLFVLEKS